MKKNEIKIEIVGVTNSGKTTIVSVVKDALDKLGFNTEIVVPDGDFEYTKNNIEKKLINVLEKDIKIVIEEKQANINLE